MNKKWFTCLVVLTLADGIQTHWLLRGFGITSEANPVMGYLIGNFGFAGMWLLKLLTLLVISATMDHYRKRVIPLLTLGMLAVVLWNATQFRQLPLAVKPSAPVDSVTAIETFDGIMIYKFDDPLAADF